MESKLSKERDYYFDNLKGFLIFTVVLGHFIRKMHGNELVSALYVFIYTFHMPLFILVSGYFSKNFKLKRIIDLVGIYAVWQGILFPILIGVLNGNKIKLVENIFERPRYMYWYLLALIVWKVVTPLLPKSIGGLLIITGISFIPGVVKGVDWTLYSIGRIISFYPFFYLGYILDKNAFSSMYKKIPKVVAIVGLVVVFIIVNIIFSKYNLSSKLLHFKGTLFPYVTRIRYIILLRSILLLLGIAAILFICRLTSSEKTILSKWGQDSLNIYLSHAIILKAIKLGTINMSGITFILLSVVFAYGYCQVLCSESVKNFVSIFTNFKVSSLIDIRKPKIDEEILEKRLVS